MPPRLNKRQQRELEELEALGGKPGVEVHDESESDQEPAPKVQQGGFAAVSTNPEVFVSKFVERLASLWLGTITTLMMRISTRRSLASLARYAS